VAHRLQNAIVDLQRITNSRKLHGVRASRAGVTISPVAGAVLRHIVDEGPVRPALLAERVRMQPSALSRQLKVLEAEGCIQRVPISGDKRGWLLRVTQRGRGIVQRLERADEDIMAGQLRNWSAADLDTLNDLLDRLIHDFRQPAPALASRKKAS
jgi:DNA-binding MarR family transcriptional regulator